MLYCFEHIPKTGGVSYSTALRLYYGDKLFPLKKDQHNSIPEGVEAIHGHRAYRTLLKSGVSDVQFFTLVRDPVKLVQSHYNHIARSVRLKHFWYINLFNFSLKKYLERGLFKDFDNGMVRRFSNIDFPYGECTEEIYQKAKERLDSFVHIGLQEKFDASLFSLSKVLGWTKLPIYFRSNTTPGYGKRSFTDEEISMIKKQNVFDIRLYEYCAKKFEEEFDKTSEFTEEYATYLEELRNLDPTKLPGYAEKMKREKKRNILKKFFVR